MIIMKISFTKPHLFQNELHVAAIRKKLCEELIRRKFYFDYFNTITSQDRKGSFKLMFEGISAATKSDGNFLVREINWILVEIGLSQLCFVESIVIQPELGDKIFDREIFMPKGTHYSNMLEDLKIEVNIPPNFICSISKEIMDEPVFLITQPETKYNFAHLRYALFDKGEIKNPLTNAPATIGDICHDENLKKEISSFINTTVEEGLTKEFIKQPLAPIGEILTKYKLDQVTQKNIDKAFRMAAAENNIPYLQSLIHKVSGINKQDDNPDNQKTAMHWAVIKGSTEAIKFLLNHNASDNIVDAKHMTAMDYVKSSNNEAVLSCFGLMPMYKEESSVNTRRSF